MNTAPPTTMMAARNRRLRTGLRRAAARIVAFGLVVCLSAPVFGQSVTAKISSQHAEADEALTLDIVLTNVTNPVPPVPPQTNVFDITLMTPQGMRSTQTTIVNGRRTDRVDVTYRYSIKPRRSGQFELPPFQANVDGQQQTTRAFAITVSRGAAGPFLECRIGNVPTTVYVGQTVELPMEIWARKFRQGSVEINQSDTWYKLILPNSTLGAFDAAQFNQPQYRPATALDADGVQQEFHVYIVTLQVVPKRPGPLDLGELEFRYTYPLSISRDVFMGISLERTRQYAARPPIAPITVKPIPTQGRPPGYNGAIGNYTIQASARPQKVPVGDPITLTLTIRGTGNLDRLSAPKMGEIEALTKDFEIPSESLAGEVQNNAKVFTLTIRALREDVKQIPPIPMPSFSTTTGEYRVDYSTPIPLTVTPAQRLSLPSSTSNGSTRGPLAESAEGLLANYAEPQLLLSDQSMDLPGYVWLIVIGMPLIYSVTWLVQRRTRRLLSDVALRRRSGAATRARKALRSGNGPSGEAVSHAVLGYVADRCNVPSGGLTRSEALRLLSTRGAPADVIHRIDGLLGRIETARYAAGSSAAEDGLISEASHTIDELERFRLK